MDRQLAIIHRINRKFVYIHVTFGKHKDILGCAALDSSRNLRVKVCSGGNIVVGQDILLDRLA